MTEKLLHYIWQFRYYNQETLRVRTGENIDIIFPGYYNADQGPDFSSARIKIGKTTWAGTIELHVKTSDWQRHQHSTDDNYKNVILHVVWEDDGGTTDIPLLELRDRVPKFLLKRYTEFMNTGTFIACENHISHVNPLIMDKWFERLAAERLTFKSGIICKQVTDHNIHWEEITWRMLARNFGMKVNADAFEAMAISLPFSLLMRHREQLIQLEALLLGQAGLLQGKFHDDYPIMLQKEYAYLKKKYGLETISNPMFYLRMRPVNFPGIRLAQLAALLHSRESLFAAFRDASDLKIVRSFFNVIANDYWHYHYRFDEESIFLQKKTGEGMTENIMINTIVPVLFAYGLYHKDELIKEKALNWLSGITAESNKITDGFKKLGIIACGAAQSQALLELKKNYCDHRKCLSCSIGNALLK